MFNLRHWLGDFLYDVTEEGDPDSIRGASPVSVKAVGIILLLIGCGIVAYVWWSSWGLDKRIMMGDY